ncbi:Rha family transcriptional regulator [Lelliottia nimipressuralis]|uniref:Rha family transcriptional regulator n=2 Tax=Lelliottia nimipressuralis TaxID=69220 RepID=A0ABY3P825_9ENTR|nr:Rha family transcriptional regulator [Lelliottia nimipressuralis]TYT35214.1 Rha family transcriptional regulator [Lelliottia nimipressuralis]
MVGRAGAEQSAPGFMMTGYANPVRLTTSLIGVSGGDNLFFRSIIMNAAIAISTESPKVFFKDGRLVTTSQSVADYFDKQHKDVLRKIDMLDCSPEFTSANFCADVQTVGIGNGAERESRCYQITKDGFMFLVMGFTGKKAARLKEAYISKFNQMEAELHKATKQQERNAIIPGGPRTVVIHMDESGSVQYTEQAPAGSMVTTVESFKYWMEQNGWLVIRKEQLLEKLLSA